MKIERTLLNYPDLTNEELKIIFKYRQELRLKGKTEEEIDELADKKVLEIKDETSI